MKIKSTHESQGEFVIIEDDDFNPETMERYGESAVGPTREEMKALLTERGIEFANNIKSPVLFDIYTAELAKG